MAYHNREKEITNILKNHERKANQLLRLAQSSRLLDTFNKIWVSIENKELPNFVSKNVREFNVADIKSEINDWIKDLKECQENASSVIKTIGAFISFINSPTQTAN